MKRNNLIDFLICLLLYIAISTIPFGKFFPNLEWLVFILNIILQISFLVFIIWYAKNKTDLNIKDKEFNLKNTLILLPTLLVCCSNLIYLFFIKNEFKIDFSIILILNITLLSIKAINEEIIFRIILLNNLENKSKIINILISSLIFSMIHIVNFINGFSIDVVLQIIYTFALGLLLSVVFYLSGSVVPCMVIHALFNVFNYAIFSAINVQGSMNAYIIVNVSVAAIVAIYVLAILFIKKEIIFRKKAED